MKRTCICFCVLLMAAGKLQAQANVYDLPRIIPPTPNAAAIEKFGTIPVNYSTGIPSISYPFWSWKKGKLSLDLGLQYHAGGHKVEDMASNTGLGWALTGLGRVTRTVRGIADDNVIKGFMYTDPLPAVSTYAYDGGYYNLTSSVPTTVAVTQYNSPYSDVVRRIVEGDLDGEQDMFSFSFNGNSGRFVFDKNKQIVQLEQTNCKVQPFYSAYSGGNPNGTLSAFRITDDKGIEYTFDQQEVQSSQTLNDGSVLSPASIQNAVSGWLLTKVKDPGTLDSIVITYINNGVSAVYETGFSQTRSYALERVDPVGGLVIPGISAPSDLYSFSIIDANEAQPAVISLPDGCTVGFSYSFERADLVNSKGLTGIKVRNKNSRILKWYQLNYNYFTATAGAPPHTSTNDFSKRLKLERIDELSGDSSIVKPTTFTYNSLALNYRGSKNIDFWGYNINPSRNNLSLVPIIKLKDDELGVNPTYGRYLSGADRSPDSVYVKAALLEKITYPTGGSTSFEYESNRAFSPIDYYENAMPVSSIEWTKNYFGQAYTLSSFTDRTSTTVLLNLKTEEFQPRPEPDPGSPQPCLDSQQDDQPATFTIRSTDNSVSIAITDRYGNFRGGITRSVELPLGKTYEITFDYDIFAGCTYTYAFKAMVSGTFYIAPQDKLAGGVRVKRIISNDSIGKTIIKEYNYNNPDGRSSATLQVIPDFDYYRTTVDESIIPGPTWNTRHISRTSNPTTTVNFFNGSPLVYKRVQERELDHSLTERQFDPEVSLSNGGSGYYPYLPWQDIPSHSGLLRTQVIRDKDGNTKSTRKPGYSKVANYHVGEDENRNLKTGTIATATGYNTKLFVVDQYFMYSSYADEITDTTITTEGATDMTVVTNKTYTGKHYPRLVTTTNSKGQQVSSLYQYPDDFSGDPVYNSMVNINMVSPLIRQTDSIAGVMVKQVTSNYTGWGGQAYAPASVQLKNGSYAAVTKLQYNNYDSKLNILELSGSDELRRSFLYDYNNSLPVAEVLNASYASVSYSSFESDGKGNWDYTEGAVSSESDAPTGGKAYNIGSANIERTALNSGTTYVLSYWLKSGGSLNINGSAAGATAMVSRNGWTLYQKEITGVSSLTLSGSGKLDELRLYPKGAQMTTYTYEPLVGITSQCDATGRMLYYEYDSFNRLLRIRDQDRNIVKSFDYQYRQQP